MKEKLEHIERVVDPLLPQPPVTVVPLANLLPVQTRQLRPEYRVKVRVRVPAYRRVLRPHRQVGQIVQPRKQTHLRELAHPGEKTEPHVRVTVLDDRVQPPQILPVRPRDLRILQRIQNRLVVLVNQHYHLLSRALVQQRQQVAKAGGRGVVAHLDIRRARKPVELRHRLAVKMARLGEVPAAEAQPHHRVTHRPVPVPVQRQPLEQCLLPLERRPQRVEEQTLPEPPRTREKVVRALLDQAPDERRLVNVVAPVLANPAKGLNANGQLASRHGWTPCRRRMSKGYVRPRPQRPGQARASGLPGFRASGLPGMVYTVGAAGTSDAARPASISTGFVSGSALSDHSRVAAPPRAIARIPTRD